MFDLNGDGNVEYDEFEKVQNAILSQTSIGRKLGSSRTGYKGQSIIRFITHKLSQLRTSNL